MTTPVIDEQLVDELLTDDPAADFSPPIGGGVDLDVSRETSEAEAPAPRRRPGPPPNPNSARSKRRAAKAAAPRKRATPNTPAAAAAPETDSAHKRGAMAVLGWAARPLAMAGLGLGLAAKAAPTKPDGSPTPRAEQLGRHGQALSLDALTLTLFADPLADGMVGIAAELPWMAGVLEKAAKVSPVAAIVEAASAIGLQMLANHGIVPVSPVLGTLGPAELRVLAGLEDPRDGQG